VLPPELSCSFDWDTLSLLSGEFVDPQFAHLHSDLLFSVQLGSDTACIYLLFEHQSRVDVGMPLRLLRYMTRIWERFDVLDDLSKLDDSALRARALTEFARLTCW
jgi:predicted transposase YdaD